MSGDIKISAKKRSVQGTGAARRMRHAGNVPAILYGSGKEGVMLEVEEHSFVQTMRRHASENLIIDLDVEGDVKKALVKDVQHHPVTDKVLHVDFLEVSMTKKIKVELPLELVGDPIGVVELGGVLEQLLRVVELECLPADMLESINVDVSGLKIGDRVEVGDIDLDKDKYTVITAPEVAIASVMAPRVKVATGEEGAEEGAAEEASAEAGE